MFVPVQHAVKDRLSVVQFYDDLSYILLHHSAGIFVVLNLLTISWSLVFVKPFTLSYT